MITLVIVTLLLYRGRAVQHRALPVRHVEGAVRVVRGRAAARRRRLQPGRRDVLPARADGGDLRFRDHRRVLQAPAHRDRPAERHDEAAARWDGSAAARGRREGRADRLLRCGEPSEDTTFGRGKIEDFTWKGYLDFATCTECGRCQSQCPAWNTGKPLSPKLVIMDLRDHLFAKAPYLIDGKTVPGDGPDLAAAAAEAPADSPSGPGGRLPAAGRLRPRSSAAAPGRRRRIVRGHRPRRAVVVHHVRGVRRAVPGRYRAHRPHRRHAPLPGTRRVGIPVRGRRHAEKPGEQGQSLGPRRSRTRGVDRRTRLRGAARHPRREAAGRHGLSVLGRLRRRVGGPIEEGHSCRGRTTTRRRSELRHSRRWPKPAPATQPGGSATSSCSRCSACKTSRPSTRSPAPHH